MPNFLAAMSTGVRRVLSVQSHVVHGYVGNRAAVFPLQLLGFDVDVINSVQFSCHTGYPVFPGQRLNGDELRTLVEGLVHNEVHSYSHLLTGFIGTDTFLREVLELRRALPPTCRYICDPVLGDNGRLYVPESLVSVYRNEVLPVVSVLTPNQFEAEHLAQREIRSVEDAADVCDTLHRLGPKTVVLTTLDVPDSTSDGDCVAMMLSEAEGKAKYLLQLPRIGGGPFTGTGDLTAAMILAWTQIHPHEAPAAMEVAGSVLQAVIRETVRGGRTGREVKRKRVPPELRLVESKKHIEEPQVIARCRLMRPLGLQGIVFDMDGTLTLPGQIDFKLMREKTGVPAGEDIVTYLRTKHAGDQASLDAALATIEELELAAFSPPALQSGLQEVIEYLQSMGIRLAIFTRNNHACVELFLREAGLSADTFSPIITRDSDLEGKPDPAPVLHCCSEWDVDVSKVLVVGDGIDDIRSGKAAGAPTAAMLRPAPTAVDASVIEEAADAAQKEQGIAQLADYTISSLAAIKRFFS